MDYTQSPFLRSDDYSSEVADLRDNINELATDISQINITLTDDIRNVNERLNVYQNNIRQNVYTNKLEANVAEINNAYIDDIYARNVKTNVLDANVLNIASINNTILVNPHIDNMDAVNGQILNAEVIDSVIVNGNGSFNSLNINTVNIDSGYIKRANITNSTLTNVVINGFDLNNPRYLNVNNADFNVANFNNIYGRNARFGYIERVNTDDVRATNIIVNGDARFHYLNANNANIRNITNTNISNAFLSNVRIKDNLVLPANLIVNGIDANFIDVVDLNATAISVQELTDVNLIHANNVSSDWGYIQNLAAHNLVLDVSKEPRETPYVLGYDANGNIFPAIAQGGSGGGGSVVLPKDADYIYTDGQGLPLKGVAATDLNDSNALVKAELVAPLVEQINDIVELLSQLNELKPNATLDYFNSISPLDYRTITAFETGKTTLKEKNNYTVVTDGILGFTGIRVENNILHLDSTLNNFNYNKDLSYMFNGCTNFDGTGFDTIPEGTTNTAFMFADTKITKPYKLPTSVTNSYNMYANVLFEVTAGETIEGINGVTYNINNNSVALDLNILNSPNVKFAVEYNNRTLYNTNLNIINSGTGFSTTSSNVIFNGGDIYLDNARISPLGSVRNANITLKGNVQSSYSRGVTFRDCEINAIEITGWNGFDGVIFDGNVSIGVNTPVKGMFGGNVGWYNAFPNIVYPYDRTNWAGLYYNANGYDQNLLNNILPTATNVDEMFYYAYNKNLFNNRNDILNVLNVLNKNITSLYCFCDGPRTGLHESYAFNSFSELKTVFPNVKNIGYSKLVHTGTYVTEEEVAGFTDISGYYVRVPSGAMTFNVPTLTTLASTFDYINNVNIVVSNNCTFAPNIYNRSNNVFLTGDLSGIKNGYYLYLGANQWFGYPENLESAPYMYYGASFNEISEPIPNGLTNTVGMFIYSDITAVQSGLNLSNCTNAKEMFRACNSLTTVDFNFLKTVQADTNTDLSGMFRDCRNLTDIPGVMDLSNCTRIQEMFQRCNNLTTVDFNFLKTLKPGADISYMFNGCNNLVLTDLNVLTYIPEGVDSTGWFSGKFVSDVNTNNESFIGMLNGLSVDGNVDIQTSMNNLTLSVVNNKSLNIDIDLSSSDVNSYRYNLYSEYYNFKLFANSHQSGGVILPGYFYNSYFEVNGGNVYFTGGQMSMGNNSRFVFTNVDNVTLTGNTRYYGPYLGLYNCNIELNNVNFLDTAGLGGFDVSKVYLNQIPTKGFNIFNIIVDGPANIDVLDEYSEMSNVSFVDNRLNINTLNKGLYIGSVPNLTDIYVNNIGETASFDGSTDNIIIHIPTNADLATGLNNGTYGNFPSENIIQY